MIRSLLPRSTRLYRPLKLDISPLFERMFGSEEDWWPMASQFVPHVNVAETDNDYEVTVELPGMKRDDIHVEIHGQELWISGEKKDVHEEKDKTYHRIERRHGEFRRMLPLPGTVDEDKIEAKFEDGVLKVHISKLEEAKPKHIEVKS